MSKVDDIHYKHIIKNIVDDAIIRYTNTITISAF
jgi:hypothetical protein